MKPEPTNIKEEKQPEFQMIVEALRVESERLEMLSNNTYTQVCKIKHKPHPESDPSKESEPMCVTESIWSIIRRISKSNSLLDSANENLNSIVGY